jgi:hypothetical protein
MSGELTVVVAQRGELREREREERCGVDVPNGLYSVWYGMTAVKYSE